MSLVPLPDQPVGVPWPGAGRPWPSPEPATAVPPGLLALVEEMFEEGDRYAQTHAVVVIHRGALVAERYAGAVEQWEGPSVPVEAGTPLLSWSMAKSVLHAVVGVLIRDGWLTLQDRPGIEAWRHPGDGRSAITLAHLLEMLDGLDFCEDYVDERASDTIAMLFGEGAGDMAAFAADRPLAAPPGERFNYSSGTSNIVSAMARDVVGAGPVFERFVRAEVFGPIGARSASLGFDGAGTWVASSYVHATARDFARFGLLCLRGGVWDGRRILPPGWVDYGRAPRSVDLDGEVFGAHWWVDGDDLGTFSARGYEGQSITLCPALDLVVVRLGKTPIALNPHLREWRSRAVSQFG